MTERIRVAIWPGPTEGPTSELAARLSTRFQLVVPRDGNDLARLELSAAIVVLTGAHREQADHVDQLEAILDADASDVVVVTADDFVGSDGDLSNAGTSAMAVAMVRSKATRRGAQHRANAVCIPAGLVGTPPSQRGPLAHTTNWDDVADAIAFLVDTANHYIHGQVIFVDGGRHLFSSMTA